MKNYRDEGHFTEKQSGQQLSKYLLISYGVLVNYCSSSRVNYNWVKDEGIRYRREIMKPKGRFRGVQQEKKKGIEGELGVI